MKNSNIKWKVLYKPKTRNKKLRTGELVNILLRNRGLKTKKQKDEFLKPSPVENISLKRIGIDSKEVMKAIRRLKKAIKGKERIIIYGDYDADGVCATAILWKTLYRLNKKALPYLPDRFTEGYGINADSIQKLKRKYPKLKLIITVDNGIVAFDAVKKAASLGIDVIITDHHSPRTNAPRQRKRHSGIPHVVSHSSRGEVSSVQGQKGKKLPKAKAIIHTTKLSGSGVAWVFAREIIKRLITNHQSLITNLDLAAIGTISDMVPLLGANRSLTKYGLVALNKTRNTGLLSLFEEARLKKGYIGIYEVGFKVAPRINAMGRLEHAVDSLRLFCTNNKDKAKRLSRLMSKTNAQRQKILDDVVVHTQKQTKGKVSRKILVLSHETYHEGVIGLAASKLVEEFYRPAIVISKGKSVSKASARSISGFNIIKNIRKLKKMIIGGGGHPMAAGFSLETKNIKAFIKKIEKLSTPLLTNEVLTKCIKVDMLLELNQIKQDLFETISAFEPNGFGNQKPTFATEGVCVLSARTVGRDAKHLKLKLEKGGYVFDAIAFGFGDFYLKLTQQNLIDVAYNISENVWNGRKNLELKIKDIKISKK